MRYALEYTDAELNGAMTFTVRLVDAATKRPYRDARFDLVDADPILERPQHAPIRRWLERLAARDADLARQG